MDTNEKVIQAVHEFENMTDADKVLTQELEDVFTEIAHTGRIQIPWIYLKPVFMFKLDKVMRDFFESSPSRNTTSSEPTQTAEFDVMRQRLLDCLESFTSAPFTIQRLCELMTEPKRHYNCSHKFMRGVEKNVLVVSTMADIEGEELINNHGNTSIPNGPVSNGIITTASSTEMTSVTDCESNGNHSEYYHDTHNTTSADIKQNALTERKEITESSSITEGSKVIEDKSEEKPEEKSGGQENDNENETTESEDKSKENCIGDNSPSDMKSIEVKASEEIVEQELGNYINKEEENLSNIDKAKDNEEKENTKKHLIEGSELDKEKKECEDIDGHTINTDEPMEL